MAHKPSFGLCGAVLKDAENRLISLSGSASETYVYDAIGRRVKRNYSGTSLSYYYDLEGHAVAMFGPSDQYLTGERFLGNMHLATHSNGRTYFSHTNLVGSTRVTTDETGAVYNNCNWWPFGDQQSCTAWPVTDIGYAGMEHDQQTGLDHTWFRYYNSRLGRFMSADPLGGDIGDPQSLNRFAYVTNDPANMIDPLGLFGCQGHPSDACRHNTGYYYDPFNYSFTYNPGNLGRVGTPVVYGGDEVSHVIWGESYYYDTNQAPLIETPMLGLQFTFRPWTLEIEGGGSDTPFFGGLFSLDRTLNYRLLKRARPGQSGQLLPERFRPSRQPIQ